MMRAVLALVFALANAAIANGAIINVPNDHATIQAALNVAVAGDTVEVETGVYNEKLTFPASGSAGSPIVLRAKAGHTPVVDGTGLSAGSLGGLIYIEDRSYIDVDGLEIRNLVASGPSEFPAGIWVRGQSNNINLLNNVVHHIENNGCGNCGAHGIAVYGTSGVSSIHDILIDGNEVRDCVLGWSEALVLNGNVENFTVSNNSVHDNNNIGIDMIGFEGECGGCPDSLDRARDGVVSGNLVYNIDSFGNPAYGSDRSADGIYVDGGTRIVIEGNTVHDANIGIEIASEHSGKATTEITVRNNFVYDCHVTGVAMGGYDTNRGSTEDCNVVNNTLYNNDTDQTGSGEMLVQFDTRNNVIENNLLFAGSQNVFIANDFAQNTGNTVDYNLYYSSGGAASSEWTWKGTSYTGFANWQAATGNDANSSFADPLLVSPATGDLHLTASSPAVNGGDTLPAATIGTVDIDGHARVNGLAVDVGADELTECGDGNLDLGEECDDGNLVDGDGCDSNCTITACGNAIVTAGEQCDDGNTAAGDCCSATCAFESSGATCDDADACSHDDVCDGAGSCSGTLAPAASCKVSTVSGKAKLILKNKDNDKGDRVVFVLSKGEQTLLADLGDPTSTTDYELCVYQPAGLLLGRSAPAGSKWSVINPGYRYKDKRRVPDGVQVAKVKTGDAGKAKVIFKGKGSNLAMPALGVTLPLTAQLHNSDGVCWSATFSTAIKNEVEIFKAKSD